MICANSYDQTGTQLAGRWGGGYWAAFVLMRSMGLLAEPRGLTAPFQLPPEAGKGIKVVIRGAGIAGLVCAWELRKAGFDCTILESRQRPGGATGVFGAEPKSNSRMGPSSSVLSTKVKI